MVVATTTNTVSSSSPEMTTTLEMMQQQHGETFLLERTIETMALEHDGRCVHPIHGHAFRQVNMFSAFLVSASNLLHSNNRTTRCCEGCQGRLRNNPIITTASSSSSNNGNNNNSSSLVGDRCPQQQQQHPIVQCVTCGVMAHRYCALSRSAPWKGSLCRSSSSPLPTKASKQQQSPPRQNNNNKRGKDVTVTSATHHQQKRKSSRNQQEEEEDEEILSSSSSSSLHQAAFAAAAAVGGCYQMEELVSSYHDDLQQQQQYVDEQPSAITIPTTVPSTIPPKSLFPFLSPKSLFMKSVPAALDALNVETQQEPNEPTSFPSAHCARTPHEEHEVDDEHDDDDNDDDGDVTKNMETDPISLPQHSMTWTPQGPPPHWACPAAAATSSPDNDDNNIHKDETTNKIAAGMTESSTLALNFVNQSLSSVSRALQDSIATPLLRRLSLDSSTTHKSETGLPPRDDGPPLSSSSSFHGQDMIDESTKTTPPQQQEDTSDNNNNNNLSCWKTLNGTATTSDGLLRDDDDPHATKGSDSSSPLNFVHHSFATVSRVLQENIMASFQRSSTTSLHQQQEADSEPAKTMDSKTDQGIVSTTLNSIDQDDDNVSKVQQALLAANERNDNPVVGLPKSSDADSCKSVISTSNTTTWSLSTSTEKDVTAVPPSSTDRINRLRLATVAGGIAGGVAGLFMAGPAGAVLGAKCGQTAGVLGVLLEGSVQIGVFVAGVAAAKYTAQQLQQMEEKRFLAIGDVGSSRKVLLVRPNVVVDPVWDEICASARKSAHSIAHSHNSGGGTHFIPFKLFPTAEEKEAEIAKRERYQRDSDIVQTDEDEIPTPEKVLLLVSRILNDKSSLPGYVYRYLIREFKNRCQDKHPPIDSRTNDSSSNVACSESTLPQDVPNEKPNSNSTVSRLRRQDAHAVIKHVTATLMDLRPELASSETMTELTAIAVEGLVFGELYDFVLEEIVQEENAADQMLLAKILEFEHSLAQGDSSDKNRNEVFLSRLSQSAIQTLLRLPQAHSAVDKLRICVQFLDCIAQHFTSTSASKNNNNQTDEALMGADSLLKMACQHIVAAKLPNLNAQVAFLEEFARDEHLLRGREGYALVTLQASTHFLNLSDNLYKDIFM